MWPLFVLKSLQGDVLTQVEWLQLQSHVSGISIKPRNHLPRGEVRSCHTGTRCVKVWSITWAGCCPLSEPSHSWCGCPGYTAELVCSRGAKESSRLGCGLKNILNNLSRHWPPKSQRNCGDYIVETAIFLLPTRQAETIPVQRLDIHIRDPLRVLPAGSPPLWFLPFMSS